MPGPVRVWIVGALLVSVTSIAANPVFAQTQPPPAGHPPAAMPPPAETTPAPPGAYPPPPPAAYPPPAGQPQPYPLPGQYPPAPYPAPYASPYPYRPYPAPEPSGPPQMVHRARKGLLIAGLVTFGVSWGLAAYVSAVLNDTSTTSCTSSSCQEAADLLWIPFAGPILAERADPGDGGSRGIFILWSLAQAAGATMTIIGLIGHDVLVDSRGRRVASTWQLLPTLTGQSQGLVLRATF